MNFIKHHHHIKTNLLAHMSKKLLITIIVLFGLISCEPFVEVEPPKERLISETVFEDAATVESALANIYVKMRQEGLVSGNFGLSISMGIYTDELDYFGTSPDILKLYSHNVLASDGSISNWWNHAYNLIYASNAIIEGVGQSETLNEVDKNKLIGQALFVRAYVHSLLTALFGEVPYITTTDYIKNNIATRSTVNEVYQKMIKDLNSAANMLEGLDMNSENVLPNQHVVQALLARLHLYSEDWIQAEAMATQLIDGYELEDIDKVFLKNSKETLWQLKLGDNPVNTYEALQLIIAFIPTQGLALTDGLLNTFEPNDLRFEHWTDSITSGDGLTTLYYAHKYKATQNTTTEPEEYPVVFRLAEQYLLRAEARAHLGNIPGAQEDINRIRNRAGLDDTSANNKIALIDAIVQERRVELFTEQGHRWFDLNRWDLSDDLLAPLKSGWRNTDVLFPIPEVELELNPNLKPQNSGY